MKAHQEYFLEIFSNLDFERIIDHPNILIAASFWDSDRYRAAITCYKFMRKIDDLIDNYKSEHKQIAPGEREGFVNQVTFWVNSIKNNTVNLPDQQELLKTFEKFRIPIWTMEAFAKSMIYDINNSGFSRLEDFLEYSRGASVAPASVFVHLCGLSREGNTYKEPGFDVREAATPCAVFSYLVHIIRDFQKDQKNQLNYFADDMIIKHGLTHSVLYEIACGAPVLGGFREMIRGYYELADIYRGKTYEMIEKISPFMDPRYQLSLSIIFNLYLMVFERIDYRNGSFTAAELNPTADEIKDRVFRTIMEFEPVEQKQLMVN